MATPLGAHAVAVIGPAAGEAAPVGIQRESKRALATTRLCPSAAENIPAHCAGDGAVIFLMSGVDATDLIPGARKSQRAVLRVVHARKVSARRRCGEGRGAGASFRRGEGAFERIGL